MKYSVRFFEKGALIKKLFVEAKSHKSALAMADKYVYDTWTNALVKSATCRRYTNQRKVIASLPKLFKSSWENQYALLVFLGKYSEVYTYLNLEEREKAYEKACTRLESAGFAKTSPLPTDTIASSAATNASKSGSTLLKTWNGCVMNAICADSQTPTPTAKSSGKDRSKYSANPTWITGFDPSPSKPDQTFAQVKRLPRLSPYPGVNKNMLKQQGQIIRVQPTNIFGDSYWKSSRWVWKPGWLNFGVQAKVKNIPAGTEGSYGGIFVRPMQRYIGKTCTFFKKVNQKGIAYYFNAKHHWCFAEEWLEFQLYGKFLGGTSLPDLSYQPLMDQCIGNVYKLQPQVSGHYMLMSEPYWFVHSSWVELITQEEYEAQTKWQVYNPLAWKAYKTTHAKNPFFNTGVA